MTERESRILVDLTTGEVECIELKAREQGISTPDFLAYCVRVLSFGINYAVSRLPKQGQPGTHEKE